MNVFFPQIIISLDECFHHLNTMRILGQDNLHALLSHDLLSKRGEVDVFPHHNPEVYHIDVYIDM